MKTLTKKAVPYLFILPTFAFLFLFYYYAVYLAATSSFKDFILGYEAKFNGLTNYIRLFSDVVFLRSLINQVLITVTSVFNSVFWPLLAAELLFFIRRTRVAGAMKTAFVIPMLVPGIVTILTWRYLYNPAYGINSILDVLGLKTLKHDWLNDGATALWSIIFVGFPYVSGLYFLIFHGGLNGIGQEIHEAAIIDGASSMDIVRKIHLPSMLPYVNVTFTLSLIGSLSGFGLVAATTGGGPGYSSMIPALHMYRIAFNDGNMGYASSMGVILFIIIIILTLASRSLLKERERPAHRARPPKPRRLGGMAG